jgi:ABC-type transport system involved in cytochrome bd biosynthesis fused ATPase/permease subunit
MLAATLLTADPSLLGTPSALDTHSEAEVQRALNKLHASNQMTMLIIAHRLRWATDTIPCYQALAYIQTLPPPPLCDACHSTVQDADRIVVLSSGRILEEGSHQQLLAKNGAYKALVQVSGRRRGAGGCGKGGAMLCCVSWQ